MTEINPKLLKPYDPKETEKRIYQKWEESGFFNPDNLPKSYQLKAKSFCIMIAPPNITGALHLGHALENTAADILIRWRRMQGFKTLWLPGTDHAGIATQNVVEKSLKKQGLTRQQLGREKFLEKIWEWREQYGQIILEQLKKLGCSLDWSRTRFTMDEKYRQAVRTAFEHYRKKGLVYRGERVINWCVKDQTALSDLEIEHQENQTTLYYLKYPLLEKSGTNPESKNNSKFIAVATTRPETMLGDSALAVHPEDKRYQNLVGEKVLLPIVGREIPIIADPMVDKEFGSGVVKVTPAHSLIDAEIAERNKLAYFKVINEFGRIINVGKQFDGLKTTAARSAVVERLKQLGLLEKEERLIHRLAKCYRCDSPVEPLLSAQWFLRMRPLAEQARAAIEQGRVRYHPEKWRTVALDWLSQTKDWCLSRQIWWGHEIPEANGQDVFDTWFSSALWPFAALGWPEKTGELKEFYPTQVVTSARDIIHLWISRMIFSGLEFTGQPPFQDVIIHGTVLTKEGKRMSKSLGTGVDPLELIEKYGADALRFGLIYQALGGQDIKFAEEHLSAGRKFCNKLWNIGRFVLIKTGGPVILSDQSESQFPPDGPEAQLLKKLNDCRKEVDQALAGYEFGRALHRLYDFVWRELADKFIEYSKHSQRPETQLALVWSFLDVLKMLHPFLPFVTEELWSLFWSAGNKNPLIVENWPAGRQE